MSKLLLQNVSMPGIKFVIMHMMQKQLRHLRRKPLKTFFFYIDIACKLTNLCITEQTKVSMQTPTLASKCNDPQNGN